MIDDAITLGEFQKLIELVLRDVGIDVEGEADLREADRRVEEAIIPGKTRAIMPVHLFGQPANMAALRETARRHNLKIIEDAAQAHGASWHGRQAGSIGSAGCFSFYPAKNLGAFGDAGALVCDDEPLATRVRSLREHGQVTKYSHAEVGYTARLDTVQALVLLRKLPLLNGWNAERKVVAAAIGQLGIDPEKPNPLYS